MVDDRDTQLVLALDIGRADPRCKLCGAKIKSRCRRCDNGEWPAPGSKPWAQWTSGLLRTVTARIEGAGFAPAVAMGAWRAMLFDEPMPAGVEPLIADVLRFPLSARRWRAFIDAAVAESHAYSALRRLGFERDEAEALARKYQQEVFERELVRDITTSSKA